jgi:hypothetical protein
MTAESAWAQWLDAVESAARTLEQRVEQQAPGREVAPEHALAMPALPMPQAPWPASLEARRLEVLATLAAATETAERRRDETAAALSRLGRAPARPARTGYTDGAALDVLG